MGKRGPPPLPTALKLERGTLRKDRTNPDEPEPDGPPDLPPWYGKKDRLSKRAREIWDARAPVVTEDGRLCRSRSEAFANMCIEQAKYDDFNAQVRRYLRDVNTLERYERLANRALELATKLAKEFGLTAASAPQVRAKKPEKPSKTGRYFGANSA